MTQYREAEWSDESDIEILEKRSNVNGKVKEENLDAKVKMKDNSDGGLDSSSEDDFLGISKKNKNKNKNKNLSKRRKSSAVSSIFTDFNELFYFCFVSKFYAFSFQSSFDSCFLFEMFLDVFGRFWTFLNVFERF